MGKPVDFLFCQTSTTSTRPTRTSADPRQPSFPPAALRAQLWITDLGFLTYWLTTFSGLLPADWAYKDHDLPVMVAWNVSFAPLDLLASLSGLFALHLLRQGDERARLVLPISLSLTFAAGLLALVFWGLRGDFEVGWWLPNLYLTLWPLWTLSRWWRQLSPPAR